MKDLSQFVDVSSLPIARSENYICINDQYYYVDDFDRVVHGKALALLQSANELCILVVTFDDTISEETIPCLKSIDDESFISGFHFKSYNQERVTKHMNENQATTAPQATSSQPTVRAEKVVGTTFHKLLPTQKIAIMNEIEHGDVPAAKAQAILIPEPTNQFDPEAVQVVVKLQTGEPFVLGYLPKESPYKKQITANCLATLIILDYQSVGYNNSYTVEF